MERVGGGASAPLLQRQSWRSATSAFTLAEEKFDFLDYLWYIWMRKNLSGDLRFS